MYDKNGNWIETFRSQPYSTEEMDESGWVLNGQPHTEKDFAGNYVAVIPLMKPAEQSVNKYR